MKLVDWLVACTGAAFLFSIDSIAQTPAPLENSAAEMTSAVTQVPDGQLATALKDNADLRSAIQSLETKLAASQADNLALQKATDQKRADEDSSANRTRSNAIVKDLFTTDTSAWILIDIDKSTDLKWSATFLDGKQSLTKTLQSAKKISDRLYVLELSSLTQGTEYRVVLSPEYGTTRVPPSRISLVVDENAKAITKLSENTFKFDAKLSLEGPSLQLTPPSVDQIRSTEASLMVSATQDAFLEFECRIQNLAGGMDKCPTVLPVSRDHVLRPSGSLKLEASRLQPATIAALLPNTTYEFVPHLVALNGKESRGVPFRFKTAPLVEKLQFKGTVSVLFVPTKGLTLRWTSNRPPKKEALAIIKFANGKEWDRSRVATLISAETNTYEATYSAGEFLGLINDKLTAAKSNKELLEEIPTFTARMEDSPEDFVSSSVQVAILLPKNVEESAGLSSEQKAAITNVLDSLEDGGNKVRWSDLVRIGLPLLLGAL